MRSVFGISRDVNAILERYMDDVTFDMIKRAFEGYNEKPTDQVVLLAVGSKNNVCFYWYYRHFHTKLVDTDWASEAAVAGNLAVLKHLKPYDARKMCKLAVKHDQFHVFKHFLPRIRRCDFTEWRQKCRNNRKFLRYIELINPHERGF